MPIEVEINDELKLVIARGKGTLTAEDMLNYQREVWASPNVAEYDEIVDVNAVEAFDYKSAESIKVLAALSAKMDWINQSRKFAIVAKDDMAFGLGRMYQSYRESEVTTRKQVQVFRTLEQARQWLGR